MQEVKKPSKKPLIYYYLITMLVLLVLNATLFPAMMENPVKDVTYDVFMSMTLDQQVDQVEIRNDEILFTDKDGNIYQTTATEDPDRTQRLFDNGATFEEIDTQPSLLASFLLTWVLPFLPLLLIGWFINRRMQKAMGGGDVKLAMASGLILGWQKFLLMLLISSISASVYMLIRRKKDGESREIPFAPFLTSGLVVAMLFGNMIIKVYLSLIGL